MQITVIEVRVLVGVTGQKVGVVKSPGQEPAHHRYHYYQKHPAHTYNIKTES